MTEKILKKYQDINYYDELFIKLNINPDNIKISDIPDITIKLLSAQSETVSKNNKKEFVKTIFNYLIDKSQLSENEKNYSLEILGSLIDNFIKLEKRKKRNFCLCC